MTSMCTNMSARYHNLAALSLDFFPRCELVAAQLVVNGPYRQCGHCNIVAKPIHSDTVIVVCHIFIPKHLHIDVSVKMV